MSVDTGVKHSAKVMLVVTHLLLVSANLQFPPLQLFMGIEFGSSELCKYFLIGSFHAATLFSRSLLEQLHFSIPVGCSAWRCFWVHLSN